MDSLSDEGHKLRNDVKNLVEQDTLKWIFVGGKGGVGKTTISCSLASLLSERRESVLLISTDPAHSLSDAFGQKFADCPRLVNGYNNLYAMEVDSSRMHDVGFSANETKTILDNVPELFQMLPGIDEALSFAELIQSVQSMKYSVIIFDTAPTGHTLKFLKLPDVLDKVVENILKVESIFGMFMRVFSMINTQLSQDEMFDKINSLKQVVKLTLDQMKNPNLTTFICVCIPEFLSVFETERLIQHLAKNDIDCSYVIINQIIKHIDIQYTMNKAKACLDIVSDDVKNILEEFFQSVKERDNLHNGMVSIQRRYISDLRDLYENYFNIVAIPRFEEEVRGHESIKKFSKVLLEHCPIPE